MSTVTIPSPILGQTVVVIGGSAGIGFETARRARAEGAKVILTRPSTPRILLLSIGSSVTSRQSTT